MSQLEAFRETRDLTRPHQDTPLLEVRDLEVWYRQRWRGPIIKACDHVSFDLHAGETLGLVGESGSGKSTLAKAILGLAPIRAGSIRLNGQDITWLNQRGRRDLSRKLQVVFQDPNSSFNPFLSVGRSLAEPLQVHGFQADEIQRRVAEGLERVGLSPDAAFRYPAQFSGGQRQRLAIARALMLSPQLVICDEAVSALDLSVQAQILNLLMELQRSQQLSYLFISHDIEVVRYLSDRIVVLYHGQVMETGTARTVTSDPDHPYTRELVDAAPVADPRVQRERRAEKQRRRTASSGSTLARTVPAEKGCPFAPRCPFALDACHAERPPLLPAANRGLVACHRYPAWKTL